MDSRKKLYRSSTDTVIFGVCAGMAEAMELSVTGMRFVWAFATLFLGPLTLIAYVVLALVLERRPVLPPVPGSDPFITSAGPLNRAEVTARLQERFLRLEKRLQNLETVVTRPSFRYESEYRDL